MRTQLVIVGATLAALAGVSPESLEAQRVSADIHIGGWPVAGTIHIGDRGYDGRARIDPRVVVVERRHGGPFWGRGGRYRVVTVYYDRHGRRFYARNHRGLERLRVFEYGGRYYRFDDRYHDGRFDGPWDRDGRDRWDRDWHDRRDRWDGNRDRRRDRDRDARDGRRRDRDRDRRPGRGN